MLFPPIPYAHRRVLSDLPALDPRGELRGRKLGTIMIRFASAIVVALVATGAAHGEALRPLEARTVALGDTAGVAYYTVGEDGFYVVATVAAAQGSPVRFIATLVPGQKVVMSVPQLAGEPSIVLEIARQGDEVFLSDAAAVAKLD